MRLLLDTHALLWWVGDLPHLGARARAAIADADTVHVSSVSAAEISIKRAKGKMDSPGDLVGQLAANRFTELPFTLRHGEAMADLPPHHSDPFDRMLVAQARVEGLTLVSANRRLADYDVARLPAGR